MEIKQPYLDFIKSDEMRKNYSLNKKDPDKGPFITLQKRPLKNPDFAAVYYTQKDYEYDAFSNYTTKYMCSVNVKSGEILHIGERSEYQIDGGFLKCESYNEISNKRYILSKIELDIKQRIDKMLDENSESYLSGVDFDKYNSRIISKYKKQFDNDRPVPEVEIELNFDIINDVYTDKNKFIEEMANKFFNEENIKNFTDYLAIEKGYEKYVQSLKGDVLNEIKDKLLDIMSNNKYKNVKIYYTNPDKTETIREFAKDNVYGVRNEIFDCNRIDDIPIKAIDKIIWGRSLLFEKTREMAKELKYTEKQQIEDFIELKHMTNFPPYVYEQDEYIEKIFNKKGSVMVDNISDKLLSDRCYMEEFINRHPRYAYAIYNRMGNSDLAQDKFFILFILKKLKESDVYGHDLESFIKKVDETLLQDKEIAKEILSFGYITYDILSGFEKEILNDPEIVDIIAQSPIDKDFAKFILPKINCPENLFKMFTKEMLQKNISFIDQYILTGDKPLMMTLLDDFPIKFGNCLFSNSKNYYLSDYVEDKDVMNQLIKVVSGKTNIEKILSELNIKPNEDVEKIYEFASNNIEFLSVLNADEAKTYFEGELSELNEIIELDTDIRRISITSAFGTFTVEYSSYGSYSDIIFNDVNGHSKTIKTAEFEQGILNFLNKIVPNKSGATSVGRYMEENKSELNSIINKSNEDIER